MKRVALFLSTLLLIGSTSVSAEPPTESSRSGETSAGAESVAVMSRPTQGDGGFRPFTRGASMESISSLGFQVQIATNLNGRMNLRSGVDALYWKKWITYGGFTAPAVVQMIANDMSFDFYPFPKRGFRISPGFVVHNHNAATATVQLAPADGGAFILNGHTYYSRSPRLLTLIHASLPRGQSQRAQ